MCHNPGVVRWLRWTVDVERRFSHSAAHRAVGVVHDPLHPQQSFAILVGPFGVESTMGDTTKYVAHQREAVKTNPSHRQLYSQ